MAIAKAFLLDVPLEVLVDVCQQLDLHDLVRVAETCKRFRHGDGDGGVETAKLPTKSPVVTALRGLAFPGDEPVPSTRPIGCFESWVAYLARYVRQRRCREVPPIAAGNQHTLFVDAAGQLLACGTGAAVGHGDENAVFSVPTPVAAMAAVRVRSVAAGCWHSLALGWDGRCSHGAVTSMDSWAKETVATCLRRRLWRVSRAGLASPRGLGIVLP
jgi:hypothetical protein